MHTPNNHNAMRTQDSNVKGRMERVQQILRARKIFEFYLPHWASNPQILLARALPRLPKFSNSLIIHEPKNESQTTGVLY